MKIYTDEINALTDIIRKLKNQDKIVLGLSGGRSILPILNVFQQLNIKWNKVHIFMVDERWVSFDSEYSNSRQIKQKLIDFLQEVNFYPFEPKFGLKKYNDTFLKLGGRFDIIILGVGEDGHIASLFPNHNALKSKSDRYIIVNQAPKAPAKRITASPKLLQRSDSTLLIFLGPEKRDVFLRFQKGNTDFNVCPAKLLTKNSNLAILCKL